MLRTEDAGNTSINGQSHLSAYRLLAIVATVACLLTLVDGAIPQLQMFLLGGYVFTNVFAKVALLVSLALAILLDPKIMFRGLPISTWKLCLGFLVFEIGYLSFECDMQLVDVLQSYNRNYLILLVGPAALALRGAVPERIVIRFTVFLFLICAVIGAAQYLTARPILYTESVDGNFKVDSWQFFDEIRAFSLFNSGLNFGIFCSLCGALGMALSRKLRWRGILLTALSALACYTTLTRNAYLIFVCTCAYSAVITFGKSTTRGLLQPLLYFALAISTIFVALYSYENDPANGLQSASSLLDRIVAWTYYGRLFAKASVLQQLFGLGLAEHDRFTHTLPLPVDNIPLAVTLHIGIVGLCLFGALLIKVWLYLRREALDNQQLFAVAAASLWATLGCAGTFCNAIVPFGAVFALAILCEKRSHEDRLLPPPGIKQIGPFLAENGQNL
jgi:hypothetical protein